MSQILGGIAGAALVAGLTPHGGASTTITTLAAGMVCVPYNLSILPWGLICRSELCSRAVYGGVLNRHAGL